MQRKTQTAIAALFALGLAGGAAAQSAGVSVGAGTDNGSAGASVGASTDAGTTANTGSSATGGVNKDMGSSMSAANAGGVKTYGDLVASLRNSDTMDADLSGYNADSDVKVTTLSSLEGQGAENGQALDNILSENQDKVDTMRSNIEANTDLMAALEAQGYSPDDVIAVETQGSTGVTFIVDDTM